LGCDETQLLIKALAVKALHANVWGGGELWEMVVKLKRGLDVFLQGEWVCMGDEHRVLGAATCMFVEIAGGDDARYKC